jgi:peptidoglycan/LPS O-acetylase OafA/YrhL
LTVNWTGYQLIFGDSANKVDMVPGLLVAWIFLLLAVLAGIGALVILLLKKDKKVAQFNASNLLFACAGLLALIAGILFFCAKPLSGATDDGYKLGAGFVIGGICGLIAGVAGIGAFVCPIVIKK